MLKFQRTESGGRLARGDTRDGRFTVEWDKRGDIVRCDICFVNTLGAGDVVSGIAKSLGFHECGGCRKRRNWLNRVLSIGR